MSKVAEVSLGIVDTTLIEDLKLHKICAKIVTKILLQNQRQFRVECRTDMLGTIEI